MRIADYYFDTDDGNEAIATFQRAREIGVAGGEETDAAELLTLLEAKVEGAR